MELSSIINWCWMSFYSVKSVPEMAGGRINMLSSLGQKWEGAFGIEKPFRVLGEFNSIRPLYILTQKLPGELFAHESPIGSPAWRKLQLKDWLSSCTIPMVWDFNLRFFSAGIGLDTGAVSNGQNVLLSYETQKRNLRS